MDPKWILTTKKNIKVIKIYKYGPKGSAAVLIEGRDAEKALVGAKEGNASGHEVEEVDGHFVVV